MIAPYLIVGGVLAMVLTVGTIFHYLIEGTKNPIRDYWINNEY